MRLLTRDEDIVRQLADVEQKHRFLIETFSEFRRQFSEYQQAKGG
jgi:hypothetical protein